MFDRLESIDIRISVFFREFVHAGDSLAPLVQFFADFQVILVGILLIGLWLYGVARKEVGYKIIALDIFYATMFAFIVYWALQF